LDPAPPTWICSTKMVDLPLDSSNWCSTKNPNLVELGEIIHHCHSLHKNNSLFASVSLLPLLSRASCPFPAMDPPRSRPLGPLLEPVVTTEFSILELACSRLGSLRACAPTGPSPLKLTTYKDIRSYLTQKTSLIGRTAPAIYVVLPTIATRYRTKSQQSPP
jgi:hypothetical protein